MLYLEMYGRLGNQLFRYAAARAAQIKYYPNEKLSINFFQINELSKSDPSFYNCLADYNVTNYDLYTKSYRVIKGESNLLQKMVGAIYSLPLRRMRPEQMNQQLRYQRFFSPLLNLVGLYWYRIGFCEIKNSPFKKKFFSGSFEDPRYFEDIREVLLEEFTPKYSPLNKNSELYNKIDLTNSICVTVRRGDFESDSTIKKLHSVCDANYFEKAISEMKAKVSEPVFFMFSDDIEWVKENIKTGCPTFYEDGTDPVWEKLRMMSNCKHFILSNSSFSWWSQWLSTNPNKIVISPKKWFNNDYDSPLIDKDWIKL